MRIGLVMLATALGCEGKSVPASGSSGSSGSAGSAPAVAAIADAAPVIDAPSGPVLPRVSAIGAREAALPDRTPCKPSCSEAKMSPALSACYRAAQTLVDPRMDARILLIGERTKGPCVAKKVVIDCCPAYKPRDFGGIAKRLGWATANLEQRKAIAWVIARVVVGGTIIDEDTNSKPAEGITTMPSATESNGGLVLDYWLVPDGARTATFMHEQLTFSAGGDVTDKVLAKQEVASP